MHVSARHERRVHGGTDTSPHDIELNRHSGRPSEKRREAAPSPVERHDPVIILESARGRADSPRRRSRSTS